MLVPTQNFDGLLPVSKPAGITSHQTVLIFRNAFRTKKIGHTGTLDPLATGLLVLCIGRATKIQQKFSQFDKKYVAEICLGYSTDTYDCLGKRTSDLTNTHTISLESIQHILDKMKGEWEFIPPMYSAKKKYGRPLYTFARRGIEIPRDPVRVSLYQLAVIENKENTIRRDPDGTSIFTLLVHCSSGTYVRSIAQAIGLQLGCGGHLVSLKRTDIGPLSVNNAYSFNVLEGVTNPNSLNTFLIPFESINL